MNLCTGILICVVWDQVKLTDIFHFFQIIIVFYKTGEILLNFVITYVGKSKILDESFQKENKKGDPELSHTCNIRLLQVVSFSQSTSSRVRVEDSVTRWTTVSHIGQGNVLRRDSSRSTQDVQLIFICRVDRNET